MKTLKHVDTAKKRKNSPESKNEIFTPPQRRTTRLKSEIFVDKFRGDLPEDKYDITKENLKSYILEYNPPRKKAKLSNSNNETLNGTDRLSDYTAKTNDQIKRRRAQELCKKKLDHKTISTDLDDQPNDLDQNDEKESKNAGSKRRKKQAKSNNTILGKNPNVKTDDHEKSIFELLDKPAPDRKKEIRNESANQLLDVKLNGHENESSRKKAVSKLSLTENGGNVKKTKILSEQYRKSIVAVSKDSSSKKKQNSIKNTKSPIGTLHENNLPTDLIDRDNLHKSTEQPKIGCRKSKRLYNSTIDIDNKTPLYSASPENINKVLRNSKNIKVPQTLKKSEKPNIRGRKNIFIKPLHTTPVISKLNESENSPPTTRGKDKNNLKASQIKSTKLSKLTKKQIEHVTTKKIPKNRLDEVLDMLNNDHHPHWEDRNVSCQPSIHSYWEPSVSMVSDQNMKLKYARQFLLRRDWLSLSKVLCLSSSKAKLYYPLLSKYAALLLAYTDKEQFDKFIQFLTSIIDSSTVLKKCTTITNESKE